MKKIFTMLSGLVLASAFSAQADKVTVTITDKNWNEIASSYTTDLTLNEDGSYTLADFMSSELPVSFKFEKPGIDGSSQIEITSPTTIYGEGYENRPYIMTADGDYMDCYVLGYQDYTTWLDLYYPYVKLESAVVYGYDPALGDQYYACIPVKGDLYSYNWDTDKYTELDCPWFYLGFWFNEPKADKPDKPEKPASKTEVTFVVKTQVDDAWVATGESFTTEIIANENQSFTIADFFRSGSPLTVLYNELKAWSFNPVTFAPTYVEKGYEDYPYLLDAEGNYMTCWNIPLDGGEKEPIYYTMINNTIDDKNAPKSYVFEYGDTHYICIYVDGFTADEDYTPTYCLESDYFSLPLFVDESTGVNVIEANDENTPVMFYNLNGQRVENPANGIFIRKQGTKTSKVVIR